MCSNEAVEAVRVNNGEPELIWEFRKCFLEDVMFHLSNYFCISLASSTLTVKVRGWGPRHIHFVPYPTQWNALLSISPIICAALLSLSALLTKTTCVHCKQAEKPVHHGWVWDGKGQETTLSVEMYCFCCRLSLPGLLSVVTWSMEALRKWDERKVIALFSLGWLLIVRLDYSSSCKSLCGSQLGPSRRRPWRVRRDGLPASSPLLSTETWWLFTVNMAWWSDLSFQYKMAVQKCKDLSNI